jgi:phosphotransacetylase
VSSPEEEEARRLAEAAEAQDTEGTEAVAVQADEAIEEQGTEAGPDLEAAEDSFEDVDEDQGVCHS